MFLFNKKKSTVDFKDLYEKIEKSYNNIPIVKKRRRRRLGAKFFRYFFYCLLFVLVIAVAALVFNYTSIKKVYHSAFGGKSELETAVDFFKEGNFLEALNSSSQAEISFKEAYESLNTIKENFFIYYTPGLRGQVEDLESLLNTVELLSRAMKKSSLIGQEVDRIISGKRNSNFSELSLGEKRGLLKLLFESSPELIGIQANLELALFRMENISSYGILWPIRSQIKELENQLKEGIVLLDNTIALSELGPMIAGYPNQSNFLLIFQNSDEIRPTGGFIGNYGILEVKDAEILRLDTFDTYHLDLPVANLLSVEPPEGLDILVKKWFMRDANWSPDFPTSAEKIEWFFWQEENLISEGRKFNNFEGEFNGLIAITPKFATDLMEITGPIVIDGVEYNKDNFNELVEYKLLIDFEREGLSQWDRKQLIGKILEEMKNKLYALPSREWPNIIRAITGNIQEKNILVWFKNEYFQNLAIEYELAGEVKQVENDYLMVVDANLGAFKTDAIMNKRLEYKVEESNGRYIANVQINYANQGHYDWRYTNYKTYTRVYVPLGSELISHSGVTMGEVKIGEELDKTYFAGYIEILPGKIGALSFTYLLPDRVSKQINGGQYNLYIQKQPGNKTQELIVDLRLDNEIKSYQPTGFYVEKQDKKGIKWSTDLNSDREFSLMLGK